MRKTDLEGEESKMIRSSRCVSWKPMSVTITSTTASDVGFAQPETLTVDGNGLATLLSMMFTGDPVDELVLK